MAANVLDNLASWSTTDASNQPDTTDSADIVGDLRRVQAVVRKYLATATTLAAATTTDLSTAAGNVVTLTGTAVTITSFGTVSAGMSFTIIANAAHTVTHNATSMILPGGASIVLAAGDVLVMTSAGSGNWKCASYYPASGLATAAALALKANLISPTFTTPNIGAATGSSLNLSGSLTLETSMLAGNVNGSGNVRFGYSVMAAGITGSQNIGFGNAALRYLTSGSWNSSFGSQTLQESTTGNYNSGFGALALAWNTAYSNVSGFGYNAAVTGSNQVQLGDSSTTTYVYGTVQNRSDARDKADVRDTVLGLEFIKALRPVDYKWDMREDYAPPIPATVPELAESATKADKDIHKAAKGAHKLKMKAWIESAKQDNLTSNGTKKRSRFHHGLIAQEVRAVIAASGVDFGGLQDHKLSGGHDVMTIGYDELIAPLIKAVQELSAKVAALEAKP